MTREEGKTLREARGETARGVAILRYYAGEGAQPVGEVYPSANTRTLLYTLHVPLGVVGVITPWNFPVAIPLWKIAPALVYGNTVVFKPAELTPLTATKIVQILEETGLPGGVLNLVVGYGAEVGPTLTGDPRVTGVSFTGSNRVGREIQRAVEERGGKAQLELGGKNPVVVLADADLDQAAALTVQGAMMSAGQKCTATSRAIVERAVLEPFTRKVVERVEALVVGDGANEATNVSPVLAPVAILTAQGASTVQGLPNMSGPGPAQAAQRNYLQSLHAEMADKGVYVGMLYIGALIENSAFHTQIEEAKAAGAPIRDWGPTVNPAHLADLLWTMHCTKGQPEAIYPEGIVDR